MPITSPTSFAVLPALQVSPARPIRQQTIRDGLIANHNFHMAYTVPPVVCDAMDPNGNGYLEATSTTLTQRKQWRRKVFRDFSQFHIIVLYENTSGSDNGQIQFRMRSDTTTYTQTGVLTANSAQWTTLTLDLNYDPTAGTDTLEMLIANGATGVVRIHYVYVYLGRSSLPNAATTEGIVPLESVEGAQDAPLTTYLMNEMASGLEIIRKTRQDTIISWSDDALNPTAYYYLERSASSPKLVLRIPFIAKPWQDTIQWSMFAHLVGSDGKVGLYTDYMEQTKTSRIEVTPVSDWWHAPYDMFAIDSSSTTELACKPGASDEICVYLDNVSNAGQVRLYGFTAWFKDAE